MKDKWELSYRNVNIWGYFRVARNRIFSTSLKPAISFGLADIKAFIYFILLPLRSPKNLVFVTGRQQIKDLVEHNIVNIDYLFIRTESITGNVILIETFRQIFRVVCLLILKLRKKRRMNKELSFAIGDYWFNRLISIFLRRHQVFYTNCVVPKIEAYMDLLDSFELQHGIIHKTHYDYCFIPNNIRKNGFIFWPNTDLELVNGFGFNPPRYRFLEEFPKFSDRAKVKYLYFGTVFPQKLIGRYFYNEMELPPEFFFQPHPRDYLFNEKESKLKNISYNMCVDNAEIIICGDSSVIIEAISKNKKLFIINDLGFDDNLFEQTIFEKYGYLGCNFSFCKKNDFRDLIDE